jgi:hypothetical protein
MSIHEAWALLQSRESSVITGAYRMRLLESLGGVSIFAVVDEATKNPGLAIAIPEAARPTGLVAYSGKRVAIQHITGGGIGDGRMAILVSLRDRELADLFGTLCENLLSRVRKDPDAKSAIDSVAEEIDRWRRFMEKHHRPLNKQAVIGLIGELAVLSMLIGRIGAVAALSSWRSPHGSLRDFELPHCTIEVKAYTASAGGLVHIYDPMQLEPDSGRELLLACQEVVPAGTGEQRLPEHIARVRSQLGVDNGLVGDFDRLIAESGYLPDHEAEYREDFELGDLRLFRVVDGFPRLPPAVVPLGVSHVSFALTVASLLRYQVDNLTHVGPMRASQGGDG